MGFNPTIAGFMTANGIHNLSPREALAWCLEGAIMLDVREEYVNEYKKFSVPESIQIPFSTLESADEQIPKERWIIVADSAGTISRQAFILLQQKGFAHLSILAGGMIEWERDGMPLLVDNKERLTGSCACQLRARNRK